MRSEEYWIRHLNLLPHPEGGFYRETYRSNEIIPHEGLPDRFPTARNFSTAIYFLLRSEDKSLFHRIKSDELWHFHYGHSLSIYIIINNALKVHTLGPNLDEGESLQVAVPANCWFGAKVTSPNGYALCSCTVAPGFDFDDFELAKKEALTKEFPHFEELISELTK
jgi:uncharacterized protein